MHMPSWIFLFFNSFTYSTLKASSHITSLALSVHSSHDFLKDLSNNFISRFTPDGRGGEIGPKYKTFQGDILQHFYENNQIVKTWFNMYVFVNQKPNLGKDASGNDIELSNLSELRKLSKLSKLK